jgi:putative effector of murein hydrolase
MILTYLILFVFYLVLDMLYAHYILALTESKAFKSAITSSIIMAMSLFGTIEIIRNHWNAIPIIIGCFCGTYLTVRLKQLKQIDRSTE